MANTMQFSVVTAEGPVSESEVHSVTIPTKDGEITVLPNHIPLVSVLTPGVLSLHVEGKPDEHVAVSGGFLQVTGADVVLLADTAERADDIDLQRAEKARKAAEDAMQRQLSEEEMAEVSGQLLKNLARLRAGELVQNRRRRG